METAPLYLRIVISHRPYQKQYLRHGSSSASSSGTTSDVVRQMIAFMTRTCSVCEHSRGRNNFLTFAAAAVERLVLAIFDLAKATYRSVDRRCLNGWRIGRTKRVVRCGASFSKGRESIVALRLLPSVRLSLF